MFNPETTGTIILKSEPIKTQLTIDASAHIRRHQQLRKIINFVSLIIGLSGAAGLFIWFWPDRLMLRFVTLVLAGFYIIWGTLTHTKANNLVPRVFWEYFSIAGLGALMLWLVI